MKTHLSDEQLEKLMRAIVDDVRAEDSTTAEVADSPATWWAIQRSIHTQKERAFSPWPPPRKFWRIFAFAAPALAVLMLTFFIFRPADVDRAPDIAAAPTNRVEATPTDFTGLQQKDDEIPPTSAPEPTRFRTSTVTAKKTRGSQATRIVRARAPKPAEIKTEFIALSYGGQAESGQIVRVKVPSSMMVSLGLVASEARPTRLVDAEVVVGDDGLSRAIRFIR